MNCSGLHEDDPKLGTVGLQVTWPASSPYVTAVGATMGVEAGSEEVACQINCTVVGETCTIEDPDDYSAARITTGGGYSFFEKPDYQKDHVKCRGRGVPDLALAGHNYQTYIGGKKEKIDGTSASAPAVAGMISQVNARRKAAGKPSVGF